MRQLFGDRFMRVSLAALALICGLAAAGAASAHDEGSTRAHDECQVPMTDWQPRDAVERMAEEHGWTVRRIRIDDGCYELDGLDAEGREIEVDVDPATLAVLEVEFDDDEDSDHGHGEGDGGEAGPSSEAGRHQD